MTSAPPRRPGDRERAASPLATVRPKLRQRWGLRRRLIVALVAMLVTRRFRKERAQGREHRRRAPGYSFP